MRIKKIHIQNYKSLVDFELDSPPPFCAFVGPNASGKSNIFEALEFINYTSKYSHYAPSYFKGKEAILSYHATYLGGFLGKRDLAFEIVFNDDFVVYFDANFSIENNEVLESIGSINESQSDKIIFTDIKNFSRRKEFVDSFNRTGSYELDLEVFIDNFSRIFVGSNKFTPAPSINKLNFNASNLSQIIGRIFQDERKREDFIEWVQILIPEFKNIKIKKSNIDGSYEFFVYEKSADKPFPKHLISDGTYNILALMAAVYQTSEPQFLCIEEPENGLHPEAIQLLVEFFREKCEDEGHHIWLNTHSPTLVRCMAIDEIVLVNKIDGETRAKIQTKLSGIDIKTDEAWLTNALGGGTLWSR